MKRKQKGKTRQGPEVAAITTVSSIVRSSQYATPPGKASCVLLVCYSNAVALASHHRLGPSTPQRRPRAFTAYGNEHSCFAISAQLRDPKKQAQKLAWRVPDPLCPRERVRIRPYAMTAGVNAAFRLQPATIWRIESDSVFRNTIATETPYDTAPVAYPETRAPP